VFVNLQRNALFIVFFGGGDRGGDRSYHDCVAKHYDFHDVEVNASTYFATGGPGGEGPPAGKP